MELRAGGVGAMMDEYERAARDLVAVVGNLDDAVYSAIRDRETTDENCRSIQTVMQHVVSSGYGYATYIRKAIGMPGVRPQIPFASRDEHLRMLGEMLAYTVETLDGRWTMTDDEIVAVRIESPWGPVYDLEQLLEHAIVHILRHRRQIERFLTEPRFAAAEST